jgi:3-oxoacyl-[acyl-carrier protein] reductase
MSVIDLFSLEGKVSLVTGARRGIGKAIALTFADAGADVAICDITLEDGQLEAVAEEIRKIGRRALAVQTDVSQQTQVKNLVNTVVDEFGIIDILVNNAGISGTGLSREPPVEQWHTVLGVNLTGCYLCSYEVAKVMVKQKKGNIINIASVEGFFSGIARRVMPPEVRQELLAVATTLAPAFTGRPYNVSKAGLIMLTKVLAEQLSNYGIRANAIAPGSVRTEMWENTEILKQIEPRVPLGRIAEPKEIATVALFLASDASSYVTGHTIIADGGLLV